MSDDDPVRLRRARIARWTRLATRLGYLSFALAAVAVSWGLIDDFTPVVGQVATVGLVVGCILLAPAMVVTYMVKAAEDDDRMRGL